MFKDSKICIPFIKKMIYYVFLLITFILLIYRISIHADIYDEIINLDISYRVALGQVPFYDCWDSFQSGDLFMAPFLWLYLKIVGKSSGIILYSRFVYLGVLIITSIIIYYTFKEKCSRKLAFLIGYLFCFFQLYGLFYLWYDTTATILLVLGCLFLYQGITHKKYNKILIFLGGIFHGLMAFAYPSYILLAFLDTIVLFLFLFFQKKEKLKWGCFFIGGGFTVAFLFFLYIWFVIKPENFIETIKIILSYRSISSNSSHNIISSIIISFFKVNEITLLPTIILFSIFLVSLKYLKIEFFLIAGILLTAIINQILLPEDMRGLANFMGYLALWTPFLYILKQRRAKEHDLALILFLWLPSILSSICVALLTVYSENGPIKSWQSFILGGIITIYLMCDYLLNCNFKRKQLYSNLCIISIICVMLGIQYNYIYLNQSFHSLSNIRIKEGIYKGIRTNDSMKSWVEIQKIVQYYGKNEKTVLAGNRLRPIYLMTDLLPAVPTTEGPCYYKNGEYHWDMTIKFFESHNVLPDIMFLEPYEIENKEIRNILKREYELEGEEYIGEYSILIYKKSK